jgi:hypothetical protein
MSLSAPCGCAARRDLASVAAAAGPVATPPVHASGGTRERRSGAGLEAAAKRRQQPGCRAQRSSVTSGRTSCTHTSDPKVPPSPSRYFGSIFLCQFGRSRKQSGCCQALQAGAHRCSVAERQAPAGMAQGLCDVYANTAHACTLSTAPY